MKKNVIFVIKEKVLNYAVMPEYGNVDYAITIDPGNKEDVASAYTYIADANAVSLALVLEINRTLSELELNSVVAFLFLPNYLSYGGQRPVFFTGPNEVLVNAARLSLSAALHQQGFDPSSLCTIKERLTTAAQLAETYSHQVENCLNGAADPDDLIFYDSSDVKDMQEAARLISETEVGMRQRSPEYRLFLQNQRLHSELSHLRTKYVHTLTELKYQREYNAILRTSHEAREIQNYYNAEYEALPLWFKRLGHLVKVLTGKRTFRSLFRDDVKKYKD